MTEKRFPATGRANLALVHIVCIQASMAQEGATNQVHGASLHAAKIEVREAPLGRCMVDMPVGKYFGK